MLRITSTLFIPAREIQLRPIRSQGAGGQNVNKVASAVHLRFDIRASSLPPVLKERLLGLDDGRVTAEGVIVLKAQQFRTQERNKDDALQRLAKLIRRVTVIAPARKPTKPSRSARRKRLESKVRRGQLKASRRSIDG